MLKSFLTYSRLAAIALTVAVPVVAGATGSIATTHNTVVAGDLLTTLSQSAAQNARPANPPPAVNAVRG